MVIKMKKRTLLWVSLRAPYDTVTHAGGKVHNYYIKQFQKSNYFDIRLLTFCRENEIEKIDLEKYDIPYEAIIIPKDEKRRKRLEKMGLPPSLLEYCFVRKKVKTKLREWKEKGYHPEFIFLQWTEMVLLLPYVKQLFPNSEIVCIEEDVTFLKLQRKINQNKGMKKLLFWIQEKMMEKNELSSLMKSDLAVLNNQKDCALIVNHGVPKEKTFVTAPFFNNLSEIERCSDGKTVIFWGAMNRPENEEAAIWFIEKVMPEIQDIRFVILGAHPSEKISAYASERIEVTGFVDDPKEYFAKCLCMVVPLKNGAGIKIKVLEGMSAGIPVLTNEIGIEGIPAKNEYDYFHCEIPQDYTEVIYKLLHDNTLGKNIGENARCFIKENFDFKESVDRFVKRIMQG